MNELLSMTAVDVVNLLRRGECSPLDLVDAVESRTEAVDGIVNAMPICCFDRARSRAETLATRRGQARNEASWLAGLPVGIKDLSHLAGVRTTMGGSPIFEDFVADESSYDVQNLERNGALPVGKLTSPEFGHNATTYSRLWGYTRNPWNTALTTGGSSGGSAAALAAGMLWAVTGGDLGSSIRLPASYCGVVGLRPSPGLVPRGPVSHAFNFLTVHGPMARNVADTSLMLDAMVGHVAEDPLSYPPDIDSYLEAARNPQLPRRIAVSTDLGITHCDSEIAALTRAAAGRLEAQGCIVEEVHPDLSEAIETFYTIRGTGHIATMGPLVDRYPDLVTEEMRWTLEIARRHTADDIATAERNRSALQARMSAFLKEYDLLICPANMVPAFPVEWTTVKEHEGYTFERYLDWIAITFAITMTGCPVLSLPCGFLRSGMPLGLQLVGAPRDDYRLLSFGQAFEDVMSLGKITPIDPRTARSAAPEPAVV